MISRSINIPYKRNSVFLFGPRQVGKSTLVRHLLSGEEHIEIDLLKSDVLLKYKTNSSQLRAECEFLVKEKKKFYVFIDEIQKCTELLDEVHYLIEKFGRKILFILTGSSARKLKKASVNMLAGRAWQYFLFPFTHIEIGSTFDLDSAITRGTLPPIINESMKDAFRMLRTYVQTYLKEEILDEAIVRNIGAFSRFLDIAAEEGVDMHKLELSNAAHEYGVSLMFAVEPIHQLGHHDGHIMCGGRRINRLAGNGVDHVILDFSVFTRSRRPTPDTLHQPLMDFSDQPLGDGVATFEILGNKVESFSIVQKFLYIIKIGLGHAVTLPQTLGLVQRQPRAFDMGRMVGFQHQGPVAHFANPIFGQCCGLQKAPCPLDAGQPSGDAVGDGKFEIKTFTVHILVISFKLVHRRHEESR